MIRDIDHQEAIKVMELAISAIVSQVKDADHRRERIRGNALRHRLRCFQYVLQCIDTKEARIDRDVA